MSKFKLFFITCKFKKAYKKWLAENPEAMDENRRILKEVGNLLGKEISENEFFYEVIEVSPSNYKTNQIVIKSSNYDIIQLIDKFLINRGIIALKERDMLRVDYLR